MDDDTCVPVAHNPGLMFEIQDRATVRLTTLELVVEKKGKEKLEQLRAKIRTVGWMIVRAMMMARQRCQKRERWNGQWRL